MKLRIIGKRGDIPFELSADEIDEYRPFADFSG